MTCKKTYKYFKNSPHRCDDTTIFCKCCRTRHNKFHMCKMRIQKPILGQPKLVFVGLATRNPSALTCMKCLSLGDSKCIGHSSLPENVGIFESCNAFSTMEEIEDQKFVLTYHSDTELNLKDQGETFFLNYLKVDQKCKSRSENEYGQTSLLNQFIENNPLKQFIRRCLTDRKYKDAIIIGRGGFLHFIFVELLALRAKLTNYLKRGSTLMMLQAQRNNLKFISLDLFLGIQLELEDRKEHYYPCNLNWPDHYDLNDIPDPEYFILTKFSSDVCRRIESYVANHPGNWSMRQCLKDYLKEEVVSLMTIALAVNDYGIELQKHLIEKLNIDVALSSPFSYFSFPSFYYVLMQNFQLSKFHLVAAKEPERGKCDYSTSKLQFKYEMFLKEKKPQNDLQSCYISKNGSFKTSIGIIPDCVDHTEKVMYFANGCFHHFHKKEDCLFIKNGKKEPTKGLGGTLASDVRYIDDEKKRHLESKYPDYR